MGVSKADFFKEVNLGAKHEKVLRLALMSEDPLDPLQYPCALTGVLIGGTFNPDGILPPSRVRGAYDHGYCVLIGGFLYHFIVMSHPPPEGVRGRLRIQGGTNANTCSRSSRHPFSR